MCGYGNHICLDCVVIIIDDLLMCLLRAQCPKKYTIDVAAGKKVNVLFQNKSCILPLHI